MYPTSTREIMLPQQQHTGFESEPKSLNFHELFAILVHQRKNTINRSVERLIEACGHDSHYPDVSRVFMNRFKPEDFIPVANVTGQFAGFDQQDMLEQSGVVAIEKISPALERATTTEDPTIAAARQRLAAVEIAQAFVASDDNFTVAV